MRSLTGAAFISLDGVIQAPGGPSEDWTGGVDYGGWVWPHWDPTTDRTVGKLFAGDFDLLLGRKTYDIFAAYWPYVGEGGEIGGPFDRAAKYVLTRSDDPLPWQNSHRVSSIDAVAGIKASAGPDLIIQGSSTLYPPLLAAGLIDRLILMTFPVILGHGKRLFGTGTPPLAMKLVAQESGATGVVVTTYEPDGKVQTGTIPGPEPSEREQSRQARMKQNDDW